MGISKISKRVGRLRNKAITHVRLNNKAKSRATDMIKDENDLNYRQKRFVSEYSISLNGTQAAIKAGYSKRAANPMAARLLAKDSIKRAVEKTQARRLTRADITAERVLTELAAVGFSATDPALPKPSDKIAALQTLARHLGLLVERREVTGSMSILNMNITPQDLESAKQLVENFRSSERPMMIEGEVSQDTERTPFPDEEPDNK